MSWTELMTVRIRTGVRLLLLRFWTSRVHKSSVKFCITEDLAASQEGLCSRALVN